MSQLLKLFLLLVFYSQASLYADLPTADSTVKMTKTSSGPTTPVIKPERPTFHPIRPRPIPPSVIYQENYYNTNVQNSCQEYIDKISKLQNEISNLKLEIDRLNSEAAKRLQDRLREKNKKELEAFEKRVPSVKSKNSIQISDKPSM